jgi:4-hydroxy-tetrahydrodipicolinate synthase
MPRKSAPTPSLQVVPYYNRPTQEGMYQHFKAIAEAVDLPVILYNVPGRTVADMSNETILRLAQIPGIVGVKDATGNIGRGLDLLRLAPQVVCRVFGRRSDRDGPDAVRRRRQYFGHRQRRAARHARTVRGRHGRRRRQGRRINNRLLPLHAKLFVEPNPVPVKWALAEMGMMPRAAPAAGAAVGRIPRHRPRALREAGVLPSPDPQGPGSLDTSCFFSFLSNDMTIRKTIHPAAGPAGGSALLLSLTGCGMINSVIGQGGLPRRQERPARWTCRRI